MARSIEKLTALKVRRACRPGRLSDGGGLYLQVTPAGVKSWVFRYASLGREHFMGLAAQALEFTILTACRSGEVLGATWDEIDLERGIWHLPVERTKAGRAHRVPLSAAALQVLAAQKGRSDRYVFAGNAEEKSLSSVAMTTVLERIGGGGVTVHGFRSTFRDWVAERTRYPREWVEIALEHRVGSAAEMAYFRSDLLEERRGLMEDWATWCAGRTVGSS